MKKYILIITVWVGMIQGGVSIHSVEFDSKAACEKAAIAYMNQMRSGSVSSSSLCVSKDSDK